MIKQHPVYKDYGADEEGNIYSLRYGKRMKQHRRRDGYVQLNIRHDREKVKVKSHHMVLECFVGLRPENTEACHNNGKREDNRLANLRWCSRPANTRDKMVSFKGLRALDRRNDYGDVFALLI